MFQKCSVFFSGETVPCDEWIPLHDIEEKLSDSSSLMNNSDNASSVFDQTNNSQDLSDSSLLDLSADIQQESTNTQPVGAKKELEIVIAIEKELVRIHFVIL
nr:uncharacterized protein LOC122273711 isoform X2 [Parasteatoda tepidariorum]